MTNLEELKKMFPELVFNEQNGEIEWKGGHYVDGNPRWMVLDGDFTADQLIALGNWMKSYETST